MAIKVAVNRALTAITALPTAAALTDGNLTLLTTATASSSATISFTSNIDSTYNSYLFKYINVHPASNSYLTVGFRDGSTAYDATKTTTAFNAQHDESGGNGQLAYAASWDLAQSTAYQPLAPDIGDGNDECASGTMHLFAPSSTTFVKHFIAETNQYHPSDFSQVWYMAGYCNVTAAIDGVQFKMSSGNIGSGTFKMYGVGDKQS